MPVSTQITLRHILPSAALESEIMDKVGKLEQFCDDITRCKVTVGLEGCHKQQGRQFYATIELHVPGYDLTVTRHHDEDAHVTVRDAFCAARRRLEDYARMRRGAVKPRRVTLAW